MPNIITHTLFADEMLLDPVLQEAVLYPHLFEVGSNGPDYLFFHNVSPARFYKKTNLRQLGSRLHQENINHFYLAALKRIHQEKNPMIRQKMISYICGHLCHWALDSCAHPYIFYRTGDCHSKSSWNHHRMESLIDAAFLKMKTNTSVKTLPLSVAITKMNEEELDAVAELYSFIANELYDETFEKKDFAQSLKDWHAYQKYIYDPKGTKYRLTSILEKPTGFSNLISGLMVPAELEDNHDVLNLLHRDWKHPVSEEISSLSMVDLYEKAQRRASKAIELFLKAVFNPAKTDAFLSFIDDRNYNMGMHPDTQPHLFRIEDFQS